MTEEASSARAPKLLDQVGDRIRVKHYSLHTQEIYVDWIKRYVHAPWQAAREGAWSGRRGGFLTHLAVHGRVAASTQNQAKSALLFLYREVLGMELPWLDNVTQVHAPKRLPVALTRADAHSVHGRLSRTNWVVASLLYQAGMGFMGACTCE